MFLIVSTLAAGLFAGAAIYVSAVEHPARVSCGTDLAVREFAPSYKRGAIMQASLALVGCVTGFIGGWQLNDMSIYHRCLDSRGCRAVHPDCHTADEQTSARSSVGPTWSRGFTPIGSMGSAACRPERPVGGGFSDLGDTIAGARRCVTAATRSVESILIGRLLSRSAWTKPSWTKDEGYLSFTNFASRLADGKV